MCIRDRHGVVSNTGKVVNRKKHRKDASTAIDATAEQAEIADRR